MKLRTSHSTKIEDRMSWTLLNKIEKYQFVGFSETADVQILITSHGDIQVVGICGFDYIRELSIFCCKKFVILKLIIYR